PCSGTADERQASPEGTFGGVSPTNCVLQRSLGQQWRANGGVVDQGAVHVGDRHAAANGVVLGIPATSAMHHDASWLWALALGHSDFEDGLRGAVEPPKCSGATVGSDCVRPASLAGG